MKMATFCFKQRLFIRNYPILQQKNFAPDYKKKLQPQISVFIKKTQFLEVIETLVMFPNFLSGLGNLTIETPVSQIRLKFTSKN